MFLADVYSHYPCQRGFDLWFLNTVFNVEGKQIRTDTMIDKPLHHKHANFDIDKVLQDTSLAEKISLLSGVDFWHTRALPQHGVPSIRLSDGPNGVRGTKFFNSVPAACLPCGTGLAATWDCDLLEKAGDLIGKEGKAKGAQCWLGPTVCVPRSPLGGRGFESMSEDPYATGKLAAAYIRGVQSQGIISTIKHWLANDQEHERIGVNVMVNERALREIHMLPFQISIREAAPGAVMSCYNKVNGIHVSESQEFLDDLLRGDWGWKGLVMSDWFGTYSTAESLSAGLDLEMPGPSRIRGQLADLAVSSRKVTHATINARARNVLEFVKRASQVDVAAEESGRDFPEDRALNRQLASSSVVLLKNEQSLLPLDPKGVKKVALIGPNMKTVALCGGGSAALQPYYQVSLYQALLEQLGPDVETQYAIGATSYNYVPAIEAANITTPEGFPGLRMRFFRDTPGVTSRTHVEETIIADSSWQLMDYSHPALEPLFYVDVEGMLCPSQTGKYEFGVATYGSASLYIDGKLIIDNTTTQRRGNFFFGKGTSEERTIVTLQAGSTYRIKIEFASAPSSKIIKPGVVNFGGGGARLGMALVIDAQAEIAKAVELARASDIAIVCGGLTKEHESEGWDRSDMELPGHVAELFTAVLDATAEKTVVVTQSGTPFNMLPWAEKARAHLHAWFGGNETGNGIADVILGRVNPGGKLPLTFPRRLEDTPAFLNFGSERGRVEYGEGIYVGYRYYERVLRDVLFPFG